MTLLPEVRDGLMAAAVRRAAPRGHRLRWSFPRLRPGAFAVALGVACTLAVAIVFLVALGHRSHSSSPAAGPPSLRALEAKLAVLRRPQTAADRSVPPLSGQPRLWIKSLTRLATTIDTSAFGRVRVYVAVRDPLGPGPRQRQLRPQTVFALAFAGDRFIQGALFPVGPASSYPSQVGSGLYNDRSSGSDLNHGVSVGIVPDGVKRVTWVFSGAGYGVSHPHPITIYPDVRNNVAVAAVAPGHGPLAHATWYGAGGRVVASAGGGVQGAFELQRIRSVNASRDRPIAQLLLAHYSLFRSVPADDPARDPMMPTQGAEGGFTGQMGLNYWQTRYVSSETGIDGRGLWITPGTRGLCISDPQAGSCGMLSSRILTGFIGGTSGGPGRQTIAGLVPDGNPTNTLVLASGHHVIVPVIDHNVYEATVRGRIIAIINRDAAGRVVRHGLG